MAAQPQTIENNGEKQDSTSDILSEDTSSSWSVTDTNQILYTKFTMTTMATHIITFSMDAILTEGRALTL